MSDNNSSFSTPSVPGRRRAPVPNLSSHSPSSSISNNPQTSPQTATLQQQQAPLQAPASHHHMQRPNHNSIDLSTFDSPLLSKVRPSSEVFLTQNRGSEYGASAQAYPSQGLMGQFAGATSNNANGSGNGMAGFAGMNVPGNTGSIYGYPPQYKQQNPELDQAAESWLADLQLYQQTLEQMASVSLDKNFKDELQAIEQWFQVLSVGERTAVLYALLQQTTAVQNRFFITVLQNSATRDPISSVLSPVDQQHQSQSQQAQPQPQAQAQAQPQPASPTMRVAASEQEVPTAELPSTLLKQYNQQQQQQQQGFMTPPPKDYYNAFIQSQPQSQSQQQQQQQQQQTQQPRSPWNQAESINRPKSATSTTVGEKRYQGQGSRPSSYLPDGHTSWASMVNTPVSNVNSPTNATAAASASASASTPAQFPPINPGNSGGSASKVNAEIANSTAMKMAALNTVNGRNVHDSDVKRYRRKGSVITDEDYIERELYNMHLQEMGVTPPPPNTFHRHQRSNSGNSNYSPSHSPSSMNRVRQQQPATGSANNTPSKKQPQQQQQDSKSHLDTELLEDVPAWLRVLRLHKYTDNLKDLDWKDLVQLTDEELEQRGVNALGARRKMLKTFEQVKEAHGV